MKHARSLNAVEILELIFNHLTKASALKDFDEIIMVLADMGRDLTSADRCTVWVVSEDGESIWTKVAHGIDTITLPKNSGIIGSALTNNEKILIDDVYKDKRFNREIDKQTGYITKSMMVIPMVDNNNEIIGAFQVINHKGAKGKFDIRDMERLMLATTYAAETLISSKLSQEIEDTQKEVVFTMGAIGEERSKETGNHVKRVAEYSKILALAYGMNEKEAELLKQASPMHDIGKVAIPDAILKKPGRFDDNEREIMNTHAELGYNMIKNSQRPLLKAAAIVAHQHHEKWDGTGYPQGLKGKEIDIYGRITAVADVFDALGSDRVYKKAWQDEKIFKLFKEERAKQFDPQLVDLFFEHLDEILLVREKFSDGEHKTINKKILKNSIKILGAYGTKSKDHETSSFFLNKTNVIDAGNLVNSLDVASADIENLWITHAHLDHIADIAPMLDNYFSQRRKPLTILGTKQTLQNIRKHFLNGVVWPDFSTIPIQGSTIPSVIYKEIEFSKEYKISENESIQPFENDHTIECSGYIYRKEKNSIAISSDTYSLKTLIHEVKRDNSLKTIVVECSFPSELEELAKQSKHLTPTSLFSQLEEIEGNGIELYIYHIKPNFEVKVINEIESYRDRWDITILKDGDSLTF
jgi:response regulator RpfG family c-di-GMP phosphodiesterase/ribonuclease BN (tRNA processing enzyme)